MNATTLTPSATSQYKGPVVPLKHRKDCPSARTLFATIMAKQDFGPIIRTLVREQVASDTAEAQSFIQAFVQWYATGSVSKTKSFVMFVGKVDQVFHTMILNSKWYMAFCHETTGVYTHHEPISEASLTDEEIMDAAMFTARLLESTWGTDLSHHLYEYVEKVKTGDYDVATVSCAGNDGPFDIVQK